MKLSQLIRTLPVVSSAGDLSVDILDVTDDSRKVKSGSLFIAVPGLTVDGHDYIEKAIENGAKAIVGVQSLKISVPYIRVHNPRRSIGPLISTLLGNPSHKLTLIGITGTDGKTTTANIIYWLFSKAGKRAGLVSTVNAKINGKAIDTGFHVSSPEAPVLQKLLLRMHKASIKYAVLEVTSHGLDQGRVEGLRFDCAVLTNITHEHMDYHKTMESYREAKSELFKNAPIAILNRDDNSYSYMKDKLPRGVKLYTYSLENDADYRATEITYSADSMRFLVVNNSNEYLIETNLLGDYNVSNILAAIATARHYKISWEDIRSALKTFKSPAGRMEKYSSQKGFTVINDFAHTPNALKRVLTLLSAQTKGKLIVITGAEGERDKKKRPLMGEVATRFANYSIFTAIDPRSEDINNINSEVEKGARKNARKANTYKLSKNLSHKVYFLIPERGEAISFAIQKLAQKDDIVIVCGKGHEKSMAYGKTEYPWSDKEAILLALKGGVKLIKRHEN